MITPAPDTGVIDLPGENRLVLDVDGTEAELVYRLRGNRLVLVHTGVPDSLGGQGVGGRLVGAAIERARREGLTIVPWCPFARDWLSKHADAVAEVAVDWQSVPSAST